jgi:ubiquinone/menaquinone biosynthesis C-methylase UbiE
MTRIESFESYSSRYEEWFEKNMYVYESELQALRLQVPEGKTGIEIGVGSGRFAEPLGVWLGVDPSSRMRRIAAQRGIEVIAGIAESLPIRDGQFDFALMVTTICFLESIEGAFREVFRILKPRGLVIIGFIDKDSPVGTLYQKYKKDNVFYRYATFYSTSEVVSHMKNVGFKDFSYIQTIFNKLDEIQKVEPLKEGHGEGSFVVIKGHKS